MSTIIEQLFQIMQKVVEWLGYPGIFLLMAFENLAPPIPSEMVMPFAGSLLGNSRLTFVGVLVAGTLGSVMGALILYGIGYRVGRQRIERWVGRYGKYLLLSPQHLDKALNLFQRHRKSTIFLARLVPGMRSLISIPAGVNRMPMGSFLVFTLMGTLVWNTVMITAGFLLGKNWQRVLEFLDTYETILYVGMAGLLLFFLIRKFQQWRELSV